MFDSFKNFMMQIKRAWDIYVNPPEESKIFVPPEDIAEIAGEIDSIPTKGQPKQVATWNNYAIVSCMSGKAVQFFDTKDDLKFVGEVEFDDQCVELETSGDFLYITSTNFARTPQPKHNYFSIMDLNSMQVVSSVETGGNWSKVIRKDPVREYVLVSNWHSHDISVISIEDKNQPRVVQILTPPQGRQQLESPRGIDFTSDGKIALVTGFYSKNMLEIQFDSACGYYFSYISPKLGTAEYGGAPRDIVVDSDDTALFSNLGDNTINKWSISGREVIQRVRVGKEPNSIRLLENNILAVSCRASKAVYMLDTKSLEIVGRSTMTGETPTGLAPIEGGFLATDFDSNQLRRFQY